jgi:polyhydroxybutyrate depolymerase
MSGAAAGQRRPGRRRLRACRLAVLLHGALLALVVAPAQATVQPSEGCSLAHLPTGRPISGRIEVDGQLREYLLDAPDSLQPHAPVPLLFDFHGFGHSATGVWNVSRFRDFAADKRFLTVYPDGLPVELLGRRARGWEMFTVDGNRDLAFVRRLLDQLERTYCIDSRRIFATGFSNGAFFTHLLGCTMADRVAAIAPVSGGRAPVACAPTRPVPVLLHHGRNDPLIPVAQARMARDAWAHLNGCHGRMADGCERYLDCRDDATVEYCEDDGAHRWPLAATERIWEFFARHPLPDASHHRPDP